ncbi:MAG TPA: PepSY domain-containing protein [Vicinamibacterales bacterium]|nr:PepSY domain-containing protein [Vicinamibacterales bacterium]
MLKRAAVFVHRWLGVALCLVFLLWFPSGIGMMYWEYPSVTAADRLDRSPALDRSKILLSPAEAYGKLEPAEPPGQLRLNTFDGRPVYRFRTGPSEAIVYADTGDEQGEIPMEMVQRIASAWTSQPASAARVEAITDVDQWTVQLRIDNLQPLWKYTWPNGEQAYVSQSSGEVVQYTTTGSRLGAYAGPITHWFYFTPLRKHGLQWSKVVIWSSGIGTFAALLGIAVALWMYSPRQRYRYDGAPTGIPYRGQKRWHMVLGLIFGVATATWAFSGMLSMEPFPLPSPRETAGARGEAAGRIQQALRTRMNFDAFSMEDPREALAQVASPVKELDFSSIAGQPVYVATLSRGNTRIVPVDGEPMREVDHAALIELITSAAGPDGLSEVRVMNQYDAYYLDRRRRQPLPVILARVNDDEQTRLYIDPKTARVVGGHRASDWVTRWVYHGLHSLDFPWLYNYRPAWDIVVITFMVGGTALCVTSLVLAWRVLGRKLARARGSRATPSDVLPSEA